MARPKAIQPVKRVEFFMNMLVHGEPGVGKSVLAGSAPKALILAHNLDETSSAAEFGSSAQVWHVPTHHEMEEAYQYIRHEGVNEFEWICWDNGTLWQEQSLDRVMEDLVTEKPHRNRWVPDMHEYLVVQNQLSTYVRQFQALPIHFLMVCHTMRTEDDDGRIQYVPMIQGGQGQLSQKIAGYMNVVAYMSAVQKKEGETRKIYVNKRSRYLAKSRWKGLQGEMSDPTITKVMDAVRSEFPSLGNPPARGDSKTSSTKRKRKA